MRPTCARTDPATAGHRYTEIDAIKAIGILTVVLIHSVSARWSESQTPGERWLLAVTRFAVPGFFLASGFLYSTRRAIPFEVTTARLRRVLLPYLVASAVAQTRRFLLGGPMSLETIAYDLLTGSSLNIYYYVFVLSWLLLCAPLLARMPSRLLLLALPLLLAFQVADELGMFHLAAMWAWRNPLRWSAYFVLGWLLRRHYTQWSRWVRASARWLGPALALFVAAAWIAMARSDQSLAGLASWLHTYAILGGIVVLAASLRRRLPSLEWLSNATYPIYLYHLYFIWLATGALSVWIPTAPPAGDGGIGIFVVSLWAVGMAGPLALIAAARWCAGSRSRRWIGA